MIIYVNLQKYFYRCSKHFASVFWMFLYFPTRWYICSFYISLLRTLCTTAKAVIFIYPYESVLFYLAYFTAQLRLLFLMWKLVEQFAG